jgi:hypothetical protein
VAAYEGRDSEAVTLFRETLRGWTEIGATFDQALTAIDAVSVLGPRAELGPAIAEARATLARLEARPLLERLDALTAEAPLAGPAAAPHSQPAPRGAEVA